MSACEFCGVELHAIPQRYVMYDANGAHTQDVCKHILKTQLSTMRERVERLEQEVETERKCREDAQRLHGRLYDRLAKLGGLTRVERDLPVLSTEVARLKEAMLRLRQWPRDAGFVVDPTVLRQTAEDMRSFAGQSLKEKS